MFADVDRGDDGTVPHECEKDCGVKLDRVDEASIGG